MLTAWRLYLSYVDSLRQRQPRPFDRAVFARALSNAWHAERKLAQRIAREENVIAARREAIMPCTPRAPTPAELTREAAMNAEIDALKYLSLRYPIARMEQAIRERYRVGA